MLVNFAYYSENFGTVNMTEEDFNKFEKAAERLVFYASDGRIAQFNDFPPRIQTDVKNAICAQVDYYALNGLETTVSADADSFTVGKVSVNRNSQAANTSGIGIVPLAPAARMYLEQTGLLNRSVPAYPSASFPFEVL